MSNYFLCGSQMMNKLHQLTVSEKIYSFNPETSLIRKYFLNKNTINFLKECRRINKKYPRIRLLQPHFHLVENDIETLNVFLYLFNAKLDQTYRYFNVQMPKVVYSIYLNEPTLV